MLRAYRAATGQAAPDGTTAAGSSVDGRKAIEGDCPICFNELQVGLCGRSPHTDSRFMLLTTEACSSSQQHQLPYSRAARAAFISLFVLIMASMQLPSVVGECFLLH